MYQEHKSFEPISENCKIWRFMDFSKFCGILETNSLFFSKTQFFNDPWEGYLPKIHYEESIYPNDMPDDTRLMLMNHQKTTIPKTVRKLIGVNCWHIGEYESEAFWRNYSNKGVVIQSTFGRLKNSFVDSDVNVYIGKVIYKDENIDFVDVSNMFNMILWKRKSFEYEQELRAAIMDSESIDTIENSKGLNIKVDLNLLIENVYTTPFEKNDWFNNLVDSIIKRYGFKFVPTKSALMNKPLTMKDF